MNLDEGNKIFHGIYMFKVSKNPTRNRSNIFKVSNKDTRTKSSPSIVNPEDDSLFVLLSLLLNLNK